MKLRIFGIAILLASMAFGTTSKKIISMYKDNLLYEPQCSESYQQLQLLKASAKNNNKAIWEFLEQGVAPECNLLAENKKRKFGGSPLLNAIKYGDVDLVQEYIYCGASIDEYIGIHFPKRMHTLAHKQDYEWIRDVLIEAGCNEESEPLQLCLTMIEYAYEVQKENQHVNINQQSTGQNTAPINKKESQKDTEKNAACSSTQVYDRLSSELANGVEEQLDLLRFSAIGDDVEVARLVDLGIDPNCPLVCSEFKKDLGYSVLCNAVYYGNLSLVAYLMTHGATVNELFEPELVKQSEPKASYEAYFKIEDILKKHGAQKKHSSPMRLVRKLRSKAKFLEEKKQKNVTERNTKVSAVSDPEQKKHHEYMLLKYTFDNKVDAALDVLSSDINVNCPQVSNKQKSELGGSPLCNAIQHGNVQLIKSLLKQGANPNVVCYRKVTPNADTPLRVAARQFTPQADYPTIIRLLVKYGADINFGGLGQQAKKGAKKSHTPLMILIYSNKPRLDVFQALIECGADVNIQDFDGNTALHIALQMNKGKEIARKLLECGADVQKCNLCSQKPLDVAKRKGTIKLISKYVAQKNALSKEGNQKNKQSKVQQKNKKKAVSQAQKKKRRKRKRSANKK